MCICIRSHPASARSFARHDTRGSTGHLPRRRGNRRARSCGTLRPGRSTHSRLRPPQSRKHRPARARAHPRRTTRQGLAQQPQAALLRRPFQALPDTEKVSLVARYHRIVEEGYAENSRAQTPIGPKRRGRPKQTKALNLLDRFRSHSPSILAFLHDFAVPFDNNQSERDLRMMKVRQKISGTFRSFDALENFCCIRGSDILTWRENG